jgi:hypothetical protein
VCGNVRQSVKTWYKVERNLRKVVRRRWNKLEKVLEKCESLEVKMGDMGEMGNCEARGDWFALRVVVQR